MIPRSAKGADGRRYSASELRGSWGGARNAATVLRVFLRSAKGADGRRYSASELCGSWGGARNAATVLRVFLRSAKVADGRRYSASELRGSWGGARGAATVLRVFLTFLAAALLISHSIYGWQPTLPDLRIEPTGGGSIFYVRNNSAQPLTAFLIELVDYPGSSYSLWQDEVATGPIAPGGEQRITVSNMTVGAAPEYVKVRGAVYADGSSAGMPDKVAQIVDRRRHVLETTRELIARLETAKTQITAKESLISDLKQWASSIPSPGKGASRNSQPVINQAAAKSLIEETAEHLATRSVDAVLTQLKAAEKALAGSRPPL